MQCINFKWLGGFFKFPQEIVSLIEVQCQLEDNHKDQYFAQWYVSGGFGKPEKVYKEYWGE